MDENRELISLDDEDTTKYYRYCFCLKRLIVNIVYAGHYPYHFFW